MKLVHFFPLLVRSAGFRGVVVWVTVGAAIAALGVFTSRAFVLSPEQQTEKYLGGAAALIEPFREEMAKQQAGIYPAAEAWADEPGVVISYRTRLVLRSGDDFIELNYRELPMPSPALTGAVELEEGDWPSRPGECLTQSVAGALEPVLGRWPLRFVGQMREIYYASLPALLCAPGTWGAWEAASDGQREEISLTASYYVTSDVEAANAFVQGLVNKQVVSPNDVLLRTGLLQGGSASAQSFLGVTSIAVSLLVGLPFVLSSITGSWIRHVQKAMALAGVAPRLWFRAGSVTLLLASVSCAVLGTILGAVLTLAARPLLRQANAGMPLSPWSLDVGWLGLSAALAAVGALAGFTFAAWSARLQMRASTAVSRPLSTTGTRRYAVVTLGCAVLSFALISASGGRRWDMVIGVLLGVAAAAAAAPLVMLLVTRSLGRRNAGPATLAGRLLRSDGRRWASNLVAITVLIGLVLSVLINISASVAAQTTLLRSPIPRGVVVVEMPDEQADKTLLQQMLSDTHAPTPVVALRSRSVVPDEGNIIGFSSLEDASAALGPLPAEVAEALKRGDIVRPSAVSGSVIVDHDGNTREASVVGYRTEADRYLNLGYGYALTPQFEGLTEGRELLLLLNLTESQEAALRDWPREQGTSALVMYFYSEPSTASFPLWLTAGFALLALLMSPIIFGLIRREVQQLKPLARDLDSLGLPRAWIRNALRTLTVGVVTIPVALATVAALATTVTLQWFYPPIFDTARANWSGTVLFCLALIVAAMAAAQLGSRNLRRSHTVHTI